MHYKIEIKLTKGVRPLVGYLIMLCSAIWVVEACCPTLLASFPPSFVLFSYFILLMWQKKNTKKKKIPNK